MRRKAATPGRDLARKGLHKAIGALLPRLVVIEEGIDDRVALPPDRRSRPAKGREGMHDERVAG